MKSIPEGMIRRQRVWWKRELQRAVYRTFFCDPHQVVTLLVAEIAVNSHHPLNMVEMRRA